MYAEHANHAAEMLRMAAILQAQGIDTTDVVDGATWILAAASFEAVGLTLLSKEISHAQQRLDQLVRRARVKVEASQPLREDVHSGPLPLDAPATRIEAVQRRKACRSFKAAVPTLLAQLRGEGISTTSSRRWTSGHLLLQLAPSLLRRKHDGTRVGRSPGTVARALQGFIINQLLAQVEGSREQLALFALISREGNGRLRALYQLCCRSNPDCHCEWGSWVVRGDWEDVLLLERVVAAAVWEAYRVRLCFLRDISALADALREASTAIAGGASPIVVVVATAAQQYTAITVEAAPAAVSPVVAAPAVVPPQPAPAPPPPPPPAAPAGGARRSKRPFVEAPPADAGATRRLRVLPPRLRDGDGSAPASYLEAARAGAVVQASSTTPAPLSSSRPRPPLGLGDDALSSGCLETATPHFGTLDTTCELCEAAATTGATCDDESCPRLRVVARPQSAPSPTTTPVAPFLLLRQRFIFGCADVEGWAPPSPHSSLEAAEYSASSELSST